jgi:hypothetical protein
MTSRLDSLGYRLTVWVRTALHAPSVEDAILEVTQGNGVSDEHASVFKLVIYVERFGTGLSNFWRRITDLYEVHEVRGGRPVGQSLFRWRADGDRFEQLAEPSKFGLDRGDLAQRASLVDDLARSGRSSFEEVESAIAEFRKRYKEAPKRSNS